MSQANIFEQQIRNDTVLQNVLTQLGTESDRALASRPVRGLQLGYEDLAILAEDPIMINACSSLSEDALKKGIRIVFGGEEQALEPKVLEEFDKYRESIAARAILVGGMSDRFAHNCAIKSDIDCFMRAQFLANVWRGAVMLLDIDDGQEIDQRVRLDQIKSIRGIYVLDGTEIAPDLSDRAQAFDPPFYLMSLPPEELGEDFNVQNNKNENRLMRVHHTRIIRFDGCDGRFQMSNRQLLRRQGWGLSSIEAIWDAWRSYESVYQSVEAMMGDASVFVYKASGLRAAISQQNDKAVDLLKARFRTMRAGLSSLGGLVIDAENESVEWASRSFAEVPNLLGSFRERLVGKSGLVSTKLLGNGPEGIAAAGTGMVEQEVWGNVAEAYQQRIREKVKYLYMLIWRAKDGPTKGKEPKGWDISFFPPSDSKEIDEVTLFSNASAAISSLMRDEIITVDEARDSMFGGDEFSWKVKLDQEAWEKKKKEAEEAAAAQQDPYGMGQFGGFGQEEAAPPEEGVPEEQQPQAPAEAELPPEEEVPPEEQQEPVQKTDSLRENWEARWEDILAAVS